MKQDDIFELRQWDRSAAAKTTAHPRGVFNLLRVLDQRAATLTKELGMADVLTLNLEISDQKDLFSGGIEVWMYGTDRKLKQVFTVQTIERKSGDTVLPCHGPESYLRRYITKNYNVYQRNTSGILNDITAEARKDDIIGLVSVDPSLEKPLDIDLSWEDLQTAVNNIINQTGGYMRIDVDPNDPTLRVLKLLPIGTT